MEVSLSIAGKKSRLSNVAPYFVQANATTFLVHSVTPWQPRYLFSINRVLRTAEVGPGGEKTLGCPMKNVLWSLECILCRASLRVDSSEPLSL